MNAIFVFHYEYNIGKTVSYRIGDPASPVLLRTGDPCVDMGTLINFFLVSTWQHTYGGKVKVSEVTQVIACAFPHVYGADEGRVVSCFQHLEGSVVFE